MKVGFGGESRSTKRAPGIFRLGGGLSIRLPGRGGAATMGTEREKAPPAPGADKD